MTRILNRLFVALCMVAFPAAHAAESERPKLRILNGSRQALEIFWLKSGREPVASCVVAPGKDTVTTTTLGHRFAITGQEERTEYILTSEVPVQAYRFEPPDPDGFLDGQEFPHANAFKGGDTNKDGQITAPDTRGKREANKDQTK